MANKALCAALLLLGLMSVASAARSYDVKHIKLTDVEGLLQRERGGGKRGQGCEAIVGTKFNVPERLHDEFIERWQKVEDETMNEKGMKVYTLKKSADSNTCFLIYGEWEDMEDWVDHLRSDYIKDFVDFVDEEDILYDICLFKQVTDDKYERSGRRNLRERREEEDNIYLLEKFTVPPSVAEDFVDAWSEAAKGVWDEKGNINYSLRKHATKNYEFVACHAWESFEHYQGHLGGKHHERLHDFLAENDIKSEKECVRSLGRMEE